MDADRALFYGPGGSVRREMRALAGTAAALRLFCGAVLGMPELGNAWWLAILLAAVPAGAAAGAWVLIRKRAVEPGKIARAAWAAALLWDGGAALKTMTESAHASALGGVPLPMITLAGAAALGCAASGGPDAAGGAARVYARVAAILGAIVAAAQLPRMRTGWLRPVLGPGIWPLAGGGARLGALAALSAIVPAAMRPEDDKRGTGALAPVLIGCGAAAVMAAVYAMMVPALSGVPDMARFRMETALSNGRSPLALQLPIAAIWYGGMFLTAAYDAAVAARLAGIGQPWAGAGAAAVLLALALGPGEGGSAWAYYALTAGPLAGVALKPKRK